MDWATLFERAPRTSVAAVRASLADRRGRNDDDPGPEAPE